MNWQKDYIDLSISKALAIVWYIDVAIRFNGILFAVCPESETECGPYVPKYTISFRYNSSHSSEIKIRLLI